MTAWDMPDPLGILADHLWWEGYDVEREHTGGGCMAIVHRFDGGTIAASEECVAVYAGNTWEESGEECVAEWIPDPMAIVRLCDHGDTAAHVAMWKRLLTDYRDATAGC